MSTENRLAAWKRGFSEPRIISPILNLLNSYGPLVDSGSDQDAVGLWVEGGGYNFTRPGGGAGRLETPEELSALYRSEPHHELITTGSAHVTLTPRISVDGDEAQAVGYSIVIEREGRRWYVERAAINHWRQAHARRLAHRRAVQPHAHRDGGNARTHAARAQHLSSAALGIGSR